MDKEERGNRTLKDVSVAQLGALILEAALNHAGVKSSELEEVIAGNVPPADPEPAPALVDQKIWLDSLGLRQIPGIDQVSFGSPACGMRIENNGHMELNRLFRPKVEAGMAFVLNRDLKGSEITIEDVLKSSEYIVPAFEVSEANMNEVTIGLEEMKADDASAGCFVLGQGKLKADRAELKHIQVKLLYNGGLMNLGSGTDVLERAAARAARLANRLSGLGVSLKAGETIVTGVLAAAVDVKQGDHFTAEFDQLGRVELTFF